jgi:hypothetical protein
MLHLSNKNLTDGEILGGKKRAESLEIQDFESFSNLCKEEPSIKKEHE